MMMLLALIPTCLRWLLPLHPGSVMPVSTSGAGIDLQSPPWPWPLRFTPRALVFVSAPLLAGLNIDRLGNSPSFTFVSKRLSWLCWLDRLGFPGLSSRWV